MATQDISAAISVIKAALEKAKLASKFKSALDDLHLIQNILDSDVPTTTDSTKACLSFRSGLSQLYPTFPSITVAFSILALSKLDMKLRSKEGARRNTNINLDNLVCNGISGLLDFLENNSSEANKAIVANKLYPALDSILLKDKCIWSDIPMSLLFTLLLETVDRHVPNQKGLRKTVRAGSHLGTLIANTKAYLPLEALLQLFIALLPNNRAPKERIKFTESTFPQEIFPCNEKIHKLLSSSSTRDGNELSIELLHILAGEDLTYPQPFDVEEFKTNMSTSRPVNRLYFNQKSMLANLQLEDEMEDTLLTEFSTFKDIQIASDGKAKVSVFIDLTSPPIVGALPGTQAPEGGASVSFVLKEIDKVKFTETLRSRGLGKEKFRQPIKLSKAERNLELDFEPAKAVGPGFTQERARDLSLMWADDNAPPAPEDAHVSTSPLLKPSTPTRTASDTKEVVSGVENNFGNAPLRPRSHPIDPPKHQLASLEESVFGSSGDDLTDISDGEHGDDTDEIAGGNSGRGRNATHKSVKGRRTTKTSRPRNKAILISDDEAPGTLKVIENKHFRKQALSESVHMLPNQSTPPPKVRQASVVAISPCTSKANLTNIIRQTKPASPLKAKPSAEAGPVAELNKKRKLGEAVEFHAEERGNKRTRQSASRTVEATLPPPTKPPTKRYGRKARKSSPIMIPDDSPPPKAPIRKPMKLKEPKPIPRPIAKAKVKSDKAAETTKQKKEQPRPRVRLDTMENALSRGNEQVCFDEAVTSRRNLEEAARNHRTGKGPSNTQISPTISVKIRTKSTIPPSGPSLSRKYYRPEEDDIDAESCVSLIPVGTYSLTAGKKGLFGPSLIGTSRAMRSSDLSVSKQPHSPPPTRDMEGEEETVRAGEDIDISDPPVTSEDICPEAIVVMEEAPPSPEKPLPRVIKRLQRSTGEVVVAGQSGTTALSPTVWAVPNPPRSPMDESIRRGNVFEQPAQNSPNPTPVITQRKSLNEPESSISPYVGGHKPQTYSSPRVQSGEEIPEIVNVIQEITQVIVGNASRRFRNVRRDLRAAQMTTLRELARELEGIQAERTDLTYRLECVQSEYAAQHTKVSNEWDALDKVTEEMETFLSGTIHNRSRHGSSKRFPKKFLKASIPDHILHPKLSV